MVDCEIVKNDPMTTKSFVLVFFNFDGYAQLIKGGETEIVVGKKCN